MENKRELKKNKERIQVDLFNRFENEKQKEFVLALEGDKMLHIQFMNDFDILLTTLTNWNKKAKTDEQKQNISEMITALLRIHTFSESQRIVSKRALAESIVNRRQLTVSLLEVQETRKEIDVIRKQIEFHERTK